MSEMCERELIQRVRALDLNEKLIALKEMPDELILNEFVNRFNKYKDFHTMQREFVNGSRTNE